LKQGAQEWNEWRKKNPLIEIELEQADLEEAELLLADLTNANLSGANLTRANLYWISLRGTILRGKNLSENSVRSSWVEKEVEAAFKKERLCGCIVLFPIRLDDGIMNIDQAWAADIRRTRHIADFSKWED
jgi:uncharacterized protein YjbI with pentapeptide repeats